MRPSIIKLFINWLKEKEKSGFILPPISPYSYYSYLLGGGQLRWCGGQKQIKFEQNSQVFTGI